MACVGVSRDCSKFTGDGPPYLRAAIARPLRLGIGSGIGIAASYGGVYGAIAMG